MMSVLSLCGICLVAAVTALGLKKYNPEISLLVTVAAGVVAALTIVSRLLPVIDKVNSLVNASSLNGDYIKILFKALGICFLCQFASDTCSDAGERSLANKIETAGRIAVVVVSLPMIEKIMETALLLIQK